MPVCLRKDLADASPVEQDQPQPEQGQSEDGNEDFPAVVNGGAPRGDCNLKTTDHVGKRGLWFFMSRFGRRGSRLHMSLLLIYRVG
jgi:hypothetical protein